MGFSGILSLDEQIRPLLAECDFIVSATRYEQERLWDDIHRRGPWKTDENGWIQTCGTILGKPINISMSMATILGFRTCFYESAGGLYDPQMVRKYFSDRVDGLIDGLSYVDSHDFSLALRDHGESPTLSVISGVGPDGRKNIAIVDQDDPGSIGRVIEAMKEHPAADGMDLSKSIRIDRVLDLT